MSSRLDFQRDFKKANEVEYILYCTVHINEGLLISQRDSDWNEVGFFAGDPDKQLIPAYEYWLLDEFGLRKMSCL